MKKLTSLVALPLLLLGMEGNMSADYKLKILIDTFTNGSMVVCNITNSGELIINKSTFVKSVNNDYIVDHICNIVLKELDISIEIDEGDIIREDVAQLGMKVFKFIKNNFEESLLDNDDDDLNYELD